MSFPLNTLNLEALFVAETKLPERKSDLRASSFYFPGALWCKMIATVNKNHLLWSMLEEVYPIADVEYNFHNIIFSSKQLLQKQKRYCVIASQRRSIHGRGCTEWGGDAVYNTVDPDIRPKLRIQTFKILSLISVEPNTAELWVGLLNAVKSLSSVSRKVCPSSSNLQKELMKKLQVYSLLCYWQIISVINNNQN